MEWKDLEKMTAVKLREEALKFPQIESVHAKSKMQLMDELAHVLGIEKPHIHLTETVVHTKFDLKHRIHELKAERDKLLSLHDHNKLHQVRREMHALKHAIRKIEAKAAHVV
jgi:cell division protein FtsX